MEYHISRGGETFGPYPEEQVKQMLEEGLLLPSDLCWAAGMAGWEALEQVFGPITAPEQEAPQAPPQPPKPLLPSAIPEEAPREVPKPGLPPAEAVQAAPEAAAYATQPQPVPIPESWRRERERKAHLAAAPPATPWAPQTSVHYPMPPVLPLGLLVILIIMSCGWFGLAWLIVQGMFVRKLDSANPAIFYFAASAVFCLISFALPLLVAPGTFLPVQPLLLLVWIALALLGILSMRNSLLNHYNQLENIGLQLDLALCVVFNVIYFQYHFSRIARLKKSHTPA